MKKETRDIWIASDGSEFETEHECIVYETIESEKGTIEAFLETQRWNPTSNKGYSDRTLKTFTNLMERYAEFKVATLPTTKRDSHASG